MTMQDTTPLMARIIQLKGTGSFADLSDAIFNKTGKRISANGLQHLASGNREGRPNTIKVLARFADRPVSWFYETDQPSTVAEARAEYFTPTGNIREDRRRRELYDQFMATGHEMSLRDLEQLIKIAKAIAADDVKYEKKKE